MTSESVRATVYLQVAPDINEYAEEDSAYRIRGARVVNSTQKRALQPKPGTVEVKITLSIPKSAFLPLRPEAVVVVPESMTVPHPIEVEAEDANGADS